MIDARIFFTNFFAIANKASYIAQTIRKETTLFELLIENKVTTEFLNVDFKTFADVLIQETARYDLNQLYPNLGSKLFGEETNIFTNKLNVSIEIKISENFSLTKEMIMKILDNHEDLANRLSKIIHNGLAYFQQTSFASIDIFTGKSIDLNNVEMRIDPIDSTKEYVNGLGLDCDESFMYDSDCIKNATVLIGAYDKSTGIPFAGVICQPFHQFNSDGLWTHTCYWGIQFESMALFSENIHKNVFSLPGNIITSYREVDDLSFNLNGIENSKTWKVIGKYGAGFKLLSLLTSSMDCCLITKASTYKWDTCGPHAILLSVGGGIVDYHKIMSEIKKEISSVSLKIKSVDYIKEMLIKYQIKYNTTESNSCNSGGFLAYTDSEAAISVIKSLLHL